MRQCAGLTPRVRVSWPVRRGSAFYGELQGKGCRADGPCAFDELEVASHAQRREKVRSRCCEVWLGGSTDSGAKALVVVVVVTESGLGSR